MNITVKLLITFLTVVLSLKNLNACVIDDRYTIAERVILSDEVVEGRIIDKQSVWLAENRIITVYEVEIDKNFKKEKSGIINVIINGGIVADEWHVSSAEMDAQLGDYGVFILSKIKQYITNEGEIIEGAYAHLGKASLIKIDPFNETILDCSNKIHSKTDLYEQLPEISYSKKASKKDNNQKASNNSMIIDCVFPNMIIAGNQDTLTIEGSGFGTFGGSSMVVFSNADNGGSNFVSILQSLFVSWTDTEIKVIVPQNAGSGPIKIYRDSGGSLQWDDELYIPFSLKTSNSDQQPTYLIDKNGFGGYTFTFGANFTNEAKEAFLRALNTLYQVLGFNIAVDVNTSNATSATNDGIDLVSFDSNFFPINSAAVAYSQFRRCGNGWEVAGLDIFFKNPDAGTIAWYFGDSNPPSNQLDFESVALHELLHSFQIGHNNVQESVMYYSSSYGQVRRTMNGCNDLLAADAINERSLLYQPTCFGHSAYYPHSDFYKIAVGQLECIENTATCNIDLIPNFSAKVFLEGFYAGNNQMESRYGDFDILPYIQPFNQAPWNYSGEESIYATSVALTDIVDWVLIELYSENNPDLLAASKAAILLEDGSVVDPSGDPIMYFPGISADDAYFINISHASHLTIQSNMAVDISMGNFIDFTITELTTLGGVVNETTDGKQAMISGDFDHNGIVNNIDYNLWTENSALVETYLSTDADGNALINNLDYNLWAINRSRISPAIHGN